MICKNCGHQNDQDSVFCEECGSRLVKAEENIPKNKKKKNTLFKVMIVGCILAGLGIAGKSYLPENIKNLGKKAVSTDLSEQTGDTEQGDGNVNINGEEEQQETDPIMLVGCEESEIEGKKIKYQDSFASSVIDQEGYDNSAAMVVDGDLVTSWQEGVEGKGKGEYVKFWLKNSCKVQYFKFYVGNWREDEHFYNNNRPKTLRIDLDGASFDVIFPNEKSVFCYKLTRPVETTTVTYTIRKVYAGEKHNDTCISEIELYGWKVKQ